MVAARQFDVCRITGLRAGSAAELAVVLQDDTLSHLSTRIVAPLVPAKDVVDVDRATPLVELDGVRYAVAMHLMMTIPARNLGTFVGTLARDERTLKNAIDTVFFGI